MILAIYNITYTDFYSYCRGRHQFSFLLRILKRLKVKDPREIELEQLEQGFSIYLNGANAEANRKQPKSSNHKSVTSPPAWRLARTAGTVCCCWTKINLQTLKSKTSYIRPHYFILFFVFEYSVIFTLKWKAPPHTHITHVFVASVIFRPYGTQANSHHSSACSLHGMIPCPVPVNK